MNFTSGESNIHRISALFTRVEKRKLLLVCTTQICLSLLDLLAIAFLSLLGALTISGVQSRSTSVFNDFLEFLGVANKSFQVQVAILGGLSAILFVTKTILSILLTRRTLFFLSARGAKISDDLLNRVINQPLTVVNSRTSQELLYALTSGVNTMTLGVVGTSITLIADLSLLLILSISLLAVDLISALATLFIFCSVGWLLYRFLHQRARKIGIEQSELIVEGNNRTMELIQAYREILVRNQRQKYAELIGRIRHNLSRTYGELAFLPFVGKYVVEITLIVGVLFLCAIQFAGKDAENATSTLAFFVASATRLAPAVLRLQQGAVTIRYSLGASKPTLNLLESLPKKEDIQTSTAKSERDFSPRIKLSNVTFTYPNKSIPALSNISLDVAPGEFIAIVGPTGSGKSTLMDVILGVLRPQSGNVEISGIDPISAIEQWSGFVGYVPQEIFISHDSIRANILLGLDASRMASKLARAVEIAQLNEYVKNMPKQIDSELGEAGSTLSGGQRQRIGIARALLTNPLVLCLDEATSALDSITEDLLSQRILQMRGKTTIIMIAHRLSTVQKADRVVFISEGIIKAVGTFEEVRKLIPDFDKQALLMGL